LPPPPLTRAVFSGKELLEEMDELNNKVLGVQGAQASIQARLGARSAASPANVLLTSAAIAQVSRACVNEPTCASARLGATDNVSLGFVGSTVARRTCRR